MNENLKRLQALVAETNEVVNNLNYETENIKQPKLMKNIRVLLTVLKS